MSLIAIACCFLHCDFSCSGHRISKGQACAQLRARRKDKGKKKPRTEAVSDPMVSDAESLSNRDLDNGFDSTSDSASSSNSASSSDSSSSGSSSTTCRSAANVFSMSLIGTVTTWEGEALVASDAGDSKAGQLIGGHQETVTVTMTCNDTTTVIVALIARGKETLMAKDVGAQ